MPIAFLLDIDAQSIHVLTGKILVVILEMLEKLPNLEISTDVRSA